jgi:hypothetical protein
MRYGTVVRRELRPCTPFGPLQVPIHCLGHRYRIIFIYDLKAHIPNHQLLFSNKYTAIANHPP